MKLYRSTWLVVAAILPAIAIVSAAATGSSSEPGPGHKLKADNLRANNINKKRAPLFTSLNNLKNRLLQTTDSSEQCCDEPPNIPPDVLSLHSANTKNVPLSQTLDNTNPLSEISIDATGAEELLSLGVDIYDVSLEGRGREVETSQGVNWEREANATHGDHTAEVDVVVEDDEVLASESSVSLFYDSSSSSGGGNSVSMSVVNAKKDETNVMKDVGKRGNKGKDSSSRPAAGATTAGGKKESAVAAGGKKKPGRQKKPGQKKKKGGSLMTTESSTTEGLWDAFALGTESTDGLIIGATESTTTVDADGIPTHDGTHDSPLENPADGEEHDGMNDGAVWIEPEPNDTVDFPGSNVDDVDSDGFDDDIPLDIDDDLLMDDDNVGAVDMTLGEGDDENTEMRGIVERQRRRMMMLGRDYEFEASSGTMMGNDHQDTGIKAHTLKMLKHRAMMNVDERRKEYWKSMSKEDKAKAKKKHHKKKMVSHNHRKLQSVATAPIGDFAPLGCNSALDSAVCTGNLLSALVLAAAGSEVVVQCGQCYTYDLDASAPHTIGGLNIIGKLYVPPNHKSELRTPYLFVQGELEMSDTNPMSPENQSMKIVLLNGPSVTFAPADSNAAVAGTPFDAGTKAFLVAGGKVNIRGWNSDEASHTSWTPLNAMAEGARPRPTISIPEAPTRLVPTTGTTEPEACPRQVWANNFDINADHTLWSGGDGKIIHHVVDENGNGYIQEKHIDMYWQGFKFDFSEIAQECPFLDDTIYLVSMKMKIDLEGQEGQEPECMQTGQNCPRLLRKILRQSTDDIHVHDHYEDRRIPRETIGKYGEWFDFMTVWKWKSADGELATVDSNFDILGNLFILERFPKGATVSLDDFVFELPSEKSFADVNDVCLELAVNGDAEDNDGGGFHYYPFYYYNPVILEEEVDGVTNRFYRNQNRYGNWQIQRFFINTDCFASGFLYDIGQKLRIVSGSSFRYDVRLWGYLAGGAAWSRHILSCPTQSEADGWMTCSGELLIDPEIASLTEAQWYINTYYEDSTNMAVVDLDDIAISFKSGPAEGLNVAGAPTSRWGPGAEVHITSSTLDWRDSQLAQIEEVIPQADTTVNLKLTNAISAVLSDADTPDMGVEVALLTRNIKIEGETDFSTCGSERLRQADYRGTTSTTQQGYTCQEWASQTPHSHSFTPENYQDAGLNDGNGNYCRNPGAYFHIAWCYTDSAAKSWDYCNVDYCDTGGYVQVLHTPNVPQVIEGVELFNMGQMGVVNRFPLQFLYTGTVAGTSIARNTIRGSNHRCISMDGVSNATIASNVAYDTAGHCYYIGFEAKNNDIMDNLGSHTNDYLGYYEQAAGHTDYWRATFFIRSPENNFNGNVAGGSSGRGWDLDMHWAIYGEDNVYGGNLLPGETTEGMRWRALRTFRDNKAHSSMWQGFRMHHFEQFFKYRDEVNIPIFENTMAYRNREHGIYSYNVISAHWKGGKISDNQWGLVLREADRIKVEDFDIVGVTEAVRDITKSRVLKLCPTHYNNAYWDHEGIHMMTSLWRLGHLDPNKGLQLRNVTISGFDTALYENCLTANPVAFSSSMFDGHFDYMSSAQGVTITDSRGITADACRARDRGVNDVVFNDLDGSFDPTGTSTHGVLVSDQDFMTNILGTDCTRDLGGCTAYCPDVCVRTFSYKVEQFGTENWKLKITNTASNASVLIPGKVRTINQHYFSDPYAGRRFSASLPAGDFTAEFVDSEGNLAWPQYVEEYWQKEPDCTGFATQDHVTLIEPTINEAFCAEIIRNGGQAGFNTTEPWIHTLFAWHQPKDLQVNGGIGIDNSDALATYDRQYHWTGLGQDIDSRCLKLMKGQMYEFTARMKVSARGAQPQPSIATIDPNGEWWRNWSPVLTINGRRYRDDTKEHMYTFEDRDQAHMARPYNTEGYNLVHGILRIPDTFRAFVEIERAPDNMDFVLSDASLKKMTCNPNELLCNGDLEEGNTKYWDTWGGDVGLDIVPGYSGIGSAIRSFQRPHLSHGQSQVINTDCVTEHRSRLAFSARIKFENSGVKMPCNPYTWADSEVRCSDIWMYTIKAGYIRQYHRVGLISTDDGFDDEDGWYHIHGLWSMTEDQVGASFTKIYFDGISTAYDVIVDNAEIKQLPRQCNRLVENSSFQDGARFWHLTERNRAKLNLYSPGAGGDSDFALRVYNRDHTWRGIMQRLDQECFVSGEEYTIEAKFRMLNATTGEGVACDTNHQWNSGQQCPQVAIYGWNCVGGNVYWRFYNQLQGFDWDPVAFNDFGAAFTVTDHLASCRDVHVYLHEVNYDYELVVDDLQISSIQTLAPTVTPTLAPTDATLEVIITEGPTPSPTSRPTVSSITSCPADLSTPASISSGTHKFGRSDTLCILTKAIPDAIDGSLSSVAPVALSYDGGDWDKAAGVFAMSLLYGLEFGNYTDGSQITLPALTGDEQYYLTSYARDNVSDADKIARLLETATFGSTLSSISSFGGNLTTDTAKAWIQNQINAPMTSHREFFRQRANPRLTNPVRAGRPGHPCDAGSRWRKYAFSRRDGELWFFKQRFEAVYNEGDTYVSIKLNGHVRTVVSSLAFPEGSNYPLEFNREYEMCGLPTAREGGSFRLRVNETTGECQYLSNPLVQFFTDSDQPATVVNLPNISAGALEQIDSTLSEGGDYILAVGNGLSDSVCDGIAVIEQNDAPVFGKLADGSWLQFDPRLVFEENTVEAPIPDGGGLVQTLTGEQTRCSNAPRTFLNGEHCELSQSSNACGSAGTPALMIDLNTDNIEVMHEISGQYIYAIDGLPLRDVDGVTQPSPCEPGLRSRWEILPAGECPNPTVLGSITNETLFKLLVQKGNSDTNILLRDIYFPTQGSECDQTDVENLVEVDILIGSQCFRRVHSEHYSVFDFTYWTLNNTHPGNMMAMMHNHSNPIKKWMDGGHDQAGGSIVIHYPAFADPNHMSLASHPIHRWDDHSNMFEKLGRFGDAVKFVDLPNEVRLDEVAQHFGEDTEIGGGDVLVCGSPSEVANDPTEGQVFEVSHRQNIHGGLDRQREHIWNTIAVTAPDQLRQRVAWALAQLLVVARGAISVHGHYTEAFVSYYDIFVRHAFGNYRDVLREVSYSPLMAENLSYLQSKSAAYTWENQDKISFADENFAREIMQLFSTGLVKLNLDGTPVLDDKGNPVLAYTNDEIMSFARVWTGFDYQQGRGNVEEQSWSGNRHDPMKVQSGWRDKFPKTDMTGGYIGDGYPLCVDLPEKMFLKKGGSYRLLGASHMPELMEDYHYFRNDPNLKKFVLNSTSALKAALCDVDINGNCHYNSTVTLDSNLECTGEECNADTVRVVQVNGIHYEFVRPACVEQAFYTNAKKVIFRERWSDSSCANPLLPYASEACCDGQHDLDAERSDSYIYDQERVTHSTANARCEDMGKVSCDFNYIVGIDWFKKGYHWTTDSCAIQVKVDDNGQVALVYDPESYQYLHPHVRDDNRNFFKVYWDGDYPKNDADVTVGNTCGNNACTSLSTGGCLCETTITESLVFTEMPNSVDEVLSRLTVGAFDPSAYGPDAYQDSITSNNDVTAYILAATGAYDTNTVFEVQDEYGRVFRFKNTYERVRIQGAPEYAFRNAPSFMSVLNTEADQRDALYETEAALDHYFYHDNTAPFIALRMIQRFTTSNPKPRYVKAVATAFRTGHYEGIGSGKYGDLAATIAAVLLDPEARSVNLDADPFKGNLREPLLKVMAVMRGMEVQLADDEHLIRLYDLTNEIGQMAHNFPTVFSFMLPEYVPGGRPGEAGLVGPETMVMDMPKAVGLLNGMFSMVKYGLTRCNGGFGNEWHCHEGLSQATAPAYLSYSPSTTTASSGRRLNDVQAEADAIISELSTILTSGRLSAANKQVIKDAYVAKIDATSDAGAALRIAQQLLLTTPEFHTTNIVELKGIVRDQPDPPTATGSLYKAIVYVMFGGGCDSYNMLVPYTCSGDVDMWDQYVEIRQEIALARESLNVLNNVTGQVCETFAVHPQLGSIQQMFNDGDLMFFTNTGVLTKETDRENYWKDAETQLFAHNWMQLAAMRIDPLKKEDGSGVLGRIRDVLTQQGLSVGAFSIDANSISVIGKPGITSSPMILSNSGISSFNPSPSDPGMDAAIASINGQTTTESGVFGEWYSETLTKSLAHNQLLHSTLADKTTNITFPNSHLGRQLGMVAKMIDSRTERGTDADVFYLSTGGWDTHSQLLMNQENLFADVDASFNAFAEEMKINSVWDSVTLIQVSDFARTLTQNGGKGSDHAWGGNYIMMGGSVKGGQIAGEYPDGIIDGSPLNIGRGRIIPTTSWEAAFLPLAEWAGANTTEELNYILPNRANFETDHYFPTSELFSDPSLSVP